MKTQYLAVFALVAILMVTVVSAEIPDKIIITSNKEWAIATGSDQVIVTAHLYNATNESVVFPGRLVNFNVIDQTLGKISSASAITGSDGNAFTTFTTLKKSGTAQIDASLGENLLIKNSTFQKIDHNDPYEILTPANYTGEETVGKTINITLRLVDKYGNLIDNKRQPPIKPEFETVEFSVSSPPGGEGAYFQNKITSLYTDKKQTLTADENGTVFATLKVDTVPGDNVVWVRPLSLAPDDYFTVKGVANGEPWYISSDFPTSEQPADGVQLFKFTYTLKDQYNNALANQGLNWTAKNENGLILDHEQPIFTNQFGWAERTFGPSTSAGRISMTGNPVANKTIWANNTVWYVNTTAVDMVLTVVPQSMASRDVWDSSPQIAIPAEITAKIIDIKGNPVKNQQVTFTIKPASYPESQTELPSFSGTEPKTSFSVNSSNTTGLATIQFWPGRFQDIRSADNWNDQASAGCIVDAIWVDPSGVSVVREVPLEWKNYPWLSVKTSVSPNVVPVNGTIDVTLQLIGDGFALQPKPIDVLLVLDDSGSMGASRTAKAKSAAKSFVSKMNTSNGDRVGLVVYNKKMVITPLTDNLAAINSAIDAIPVGGTGDHTRMREALKQGITIMKNSDHSRSVKAIIHMTDGDWSMEGTPTPSTTATGFNDTFNEATELHKIWAGNVMPPITASFKYYDDLGGGSTNYGTISAPLNAIGDWNDDDHESTQGYSSRVDWYFTQTAESEQNMSVYARNSKIKLYSMAFENAPRTITNASLQNMADSTGAFYQFAPDEAALNFLYTKIAGQLKEDAGVNTKIDVNLDNVIINSTPYSGGDVFTYQKYSREDKYWHNVTPVVHISPYPINNKDNSLDWTAANHYTLKFDVGTIKLYQTWQVVYTLKVLKEGNINVFGDNSFVTFNDGVTLKLPDTYITAAYNITTPILGNPNLELSNLQEQVRSDIVREWTWSRNYTGTATLTEKYYISLDNGQRWIQIGDGATDTKGTSKGRFVLDLKKIPGAVDAPDTVLFRVVATAVDVGSPVQNSAESLNGIINPTKFTLNLNNG